jgi:hypothetical protein
MLLVVALLTKERKEGGMVGVEEEEDAEVDLEVAVEGVEVDGKDVHPAVKHQQMIMLMTIPTLLASLLLWVKTREVAEGVVLAEAAEESSRRIQRMEKRKLPQKHQHQKQLRKFQLELSDQSKL